MLTLPFLALALGLVPSVQACAVHNGARVKARAAHDNTEELARITARQQPPVGNGRTAITNVQIFNGNGLSVPSTVILTGEFITQIGPSALTPVIGATIIDGQGGVLLPGLIDNHCHPERLSDITNSTSWGVTTAIGMACLSYSSCNALKNLNGLTSFITTGIPATGPGSPHQVLLGFPLSETISSPEQAPQFVANVFGNGSAFLKMVAEQGGLDQATLNALVEYTHQAGHVSTTHATTNATYWQAIQSQVDSIQHVPIDMPLSTAAAQQILQQRQFVTPTLNIFPYLLGIPGGLPGGTPPGSQYANAAESAKTLYVTGVPILVGTDSFEDPDNPLLAVRNCAHFSHNRRSDQRIRRYRSEVPCTMSWNC